MGLRLFMDAENITKLAKYRKKKKYSQMQLAQISSVNVWDIRKFEQRQRNIDTTSAKNVKLLADALDCKMENLLEGEYRAKKIKHRKKDILRL